MQQHNKFKINPAFKSFEEARIFARSLNLTSRNDWENYAKGKRPDLPLRPPDIPCQPCVFYRYHGWSGYSDFLGYPAKRRFRQFRKARNFVRSLNFSIILQWQQYCQAKITDYGVKPKDIPSAPHQVYKNRGWISYSDWFGNAMVEYNGKLYEPFVDARNYVRSLGIKSIEQWVEFCENKSFSKFPDCPDGIPRFPYLAYEHYGWRSWEDFLGTSEARGIIEYRDFAKARNFARALRLKNHQDWREYCRGKLINQQPKPNDIPQNPAQVYKKSGWISWGDFLGTGNIASTGHKFRTFEKARDFVRKLSLKDGKQWLEYCKSGNKPDDIPTNPHRSYREKWQGMGDWLGTGRIANRNMKFRSFGQARKFVHKLKLKNSKQWWEYCKSGNRPEDIPSNPHVIYYNKGWQSYKDWFNNWNRHSSKNHYLSYEETLAFVQKLGIKTCTEWRFYVKGEMPNLPPRPSDVPYHPDTHYKGCGWVSWKRFLGTEKC